MNVSIRRQGILIRNFPAMTEVLRIGSGNDCEIQLNDPYLAPLVAQIVLSHGIWRIVDGGTSMEGVRKNGVRIIDEAMEPGQTYVVGAFELLTDANRPDLPAAHGGEEAIPMTMVSSSVAEIPGTMIQSRAQSRPAAGGEPPRGGSLRFEPLRAPAAAYATPPRRSTPSRSRAIPIVITAAFVTIIGGLAVIVMTAPKPKPKPPAAALPAAGVPAATAHPVAPPPPPDGMQLARNLQLDQAIAAWEAAVAAGTADAATKQRIVNGALEIGHVYAAANDTVTARRYFEKVVRYAEPDSAAARYARSRLSS
jgi:hypothetical protein